ncbi:hypothetical protein ACG74X_04010 [Marivita sp. S0852]|uniref:hypothetical protein n=1 Tax=Marivita sp. S0852 TaxID=3373893 RepID=UPI0039819D80
MQDDLFRKLRTFERHRLTDLFHKSSRLSDHRAKGCDRTGRAREAGKPGCQVLRRGEAAWQNAQRTEGRFSTKTWHEVLGDFVDDTDLVTRIKTKSPR